MSHALFTELDGHRIAYETRGRGDGAIVFVHGWTSGRWQWRAQMERDDWNRRLLALDLPGHGDSDKPDVRYSMTFFARAAAAAMDAAGIARAVLVGHSNGVPVIRQFYRLHPERTEGLVAVDGALRGLPPERMQWFRAAVERPDYEEFLRKMIEQGPRMVGSDADWERIKEGQLAMPRHVMLGGIDAMADPSVWTEDPIAVPLLVMVAQPQLVGDDYEAFVRRLAPHAEYQRWERARTSSRSSKLNGSTRRCGRGWAACPPRRHRARASLRDFRARKNEESTGWFERHTDVVARDAGSPGAAVGGTAPTGTWSPAPARPDTP